MISSFVADVLKPVLLETLSSLHHSKNAAPMSAIGRADVFRETAFDCYVGAIDIASFTQTTAERRLEIGRSLCRRLFRKPTTGVVGLLRAHRQRARRRTTDQCDELAPPHRPPLQAEDRTLPC